MHEYTSQHHVAVADWNIRDEFPVGGKLSNQWNQIKL